MPRSAADTRDRLLRAAAAEILSEGYASASLSSIAARLGVTKGALAYHFPSKLDVVDALMEHSTRVYEQLARDVRDDGVRGIRAIIVLMARIDSLARTDVRFAAANALTVTPGTTRLDLPDLLPALIDTYAQFLSEAIADGDVRPDVDIVEAAEDLLAGSIGTFLLFTRYPQRQGTRPMRVTRRQLEAIGVADADRIIDEVIASTPAVPPPFDEPRVEQTPD